MQPSWRDAKLTGKLEFCRVTLTTSKYAEVYKSEITAASKTCPANSLPGMCSFLETPAATPFMNGCTPMPLHPPLNLLTDPNSSHRNRASADEFLASRSKPRGLTKGTPETRYKCSLCEYSSYIRALCEHHMSRMHSSCDRPGPAEVVLLPQPDKSVPPMASCLPPVRNAELNSPSPTMSTSSTSSTSSTNSTNSMPASMPSPGDQPSFRVALEPQSQTRNEFPKLQVCQYRGCGYASNSNKFFQRHVLYAHRKKRELCCTRCKFTTRDSILYKSHLLKHLGL